MWVLLVVKCLNFNVILWICLNFCKLKFLKIIDENLFKVVILILCFWVWVIVFIILWVVVLILLEVSIFGRK